MRYMVRFTTRDPASEEVLSLVPAERERVRALHHEGTLEELYLATDRSSGWLVMRGASLERIEDALASLPLHPYLDLEMTVSQE